MKIKHMQFILTLSSTLKMPKLYMIYIYILRNIYGRPVSVFSTKESDVTMSKALWCFISYSSSKSANI